jgi:CRISPR-associated protein Cmr5
MQTLQQQRAAHALAGVKGLISLGEGKKLKARASELPFMIHANGLGQAAAFFCSKKDKDGYDKIYTLLQNWMTRADGPLASTDGMMEAITRADLHTYRVAQAEAMKYMDWVKKFASAYL